MSLPNRMPDGRWKRGTPDEYRYSTRSLESQRVLNAALYFYIKSGMGGDRCTTIAEREREKLERVLERRR